MTVTIKWKGSVRTEKNEEPTRFHACRETGRHPNLSLIMTAMAFVILLCAVISVISAAGTDIYTGVLLNGEQLGVVERPAVMEDAVSRVLKSLSDKDTDAVDFRISYSFRSAKESSLLDSDDCYALLNSYLSANFTEACALSIGGERIANLSDEYTARTLVSRLRREYGSLLSEGTDFTLLANSGYESVYCPKQSVSDTERVYETLMARCRASLGIADEDTTDLIEVNDGAKRASYSSERIYYYGSSFGGDVLKNASHLNESTDEVERMFSKVPEECTETVTETATELIPYPTETIETSDYYVGVTVIGTEGAAGIAEITYEVTTVSGKEVSRTETGRTVLSEPVPCVQYVGTRPYPSSTPSGYWIYPLASYNYISSEFGWREDPFTGEWRYHSGMDFAAYAWTPIYAVDGGTVISAGWDSSYGINCVIDHGFGLTVRYAHMVALGDGVYAGAKVYQGMQVGSVGMTGRATGYHLHFEVQLWGTVTNPRDYLPK